MHSGILINLHHHYVHGPDCPLWLRPGSFLGVFRPLVDGSGVSSQAAARGPVPPSTVIIPQASAPLNLQLQCRPRRLLPNSVYIPPLVLCCVLSNYPVSPTVEDVHNTFRRAWCSRNQESDPAPWAFPGSSSVVRNDLSHDTRSATPRPRSVRQPPASL